MNEAIIGFDSAWADRVPGGICVLTMRDGQPHGFMRPRPAHFSQAAEIIKAAQSVSDYVLVALDQPTLVPNDLSIRPVERVAGSIVNRLGGGVQPANRSKLSMFGPEAPVWDFLDTIDARENPDVARSASKGLFLIEVFPALALPSFVSAIWARKRAAKYNPATPKFLLEDWLLVSGGIADLARKCGLVEVAQAAQELHDQPSPRKGDQDLLDALISLMIGYLWRYAPREQLMLMGDETHGYMVTPASSSIRDVLTSAARENSVPIDEPFLQDAARLSDQRSRPVPLASAKLIKAFSTRPAADKNAKFCPECGYAFKHGTWGGIDSHWKAYHLDVMPYERAFPLIKQGYKPSECS